MPLVLHDTLTGEKKPFKTEEPGHARLYVCGPTVQEVAHLGHARSFTVFDVLVRHLRRSMKVTFVRNITDVDDKILKKAAEKNEEPLAYSRRISAEWARDMEALGNLPPDREPRVSDHIEEICALTARLIEKGAAYAVDGDVYFRVNAFPGYGKLSHRKLDDMLAGASGRVSADEEKKKEHPADFALWKGVSAGDAVLSWPSPWGPGRPGWHIECSAMAMKHLGETIDLHGGGLDLVFPHHENEIAQTEAATGKPFSTCWVHHGFIETNREKMSKSLGNFFTVRESFRYAIPEAIRYYVMTGHYRAPMALDWTLDEKGQVIGFPQIEDAERRVEYVYTTKERFAAIPAELAVDPGKAPKEIAGFRAAFDEALDDDLNLPNVLAAVYDVLRAANELADLAQRKKKVSRAAVDAVRDAFALIADVLGLGTADPRTTLETIRANRARARNIDGAEVERAIEERRAARTAKDFARADAVRAALLAKGVELMDAPGGGTTWRIP